MGIEYNNARDGTLSGFFSCGSSNGIGGSGASDLASLGVGWDERLFHFCFPTISARFLLLFLITIGCLF